jgi:hypothetical protein
MTKRAYLIGLSLNLLVAIIGLGISVRGLCRSWGTLVYIGKLDNLPVEVDSIVKTALSRSDHMFALLFVCFMIMLVINSYLLFRTVLQNK